LKELRKRFPETASLCGDLGLRMGVLTEVRSFRLKSRRLLTNQTVTVSEAIVDLLKVVLGIAAVVLLFVIIPRSSRVVSPRRDIPVTPLVKPLSLKDLGETDDLQNKETKEIRKFDKQ
jgi:hypothetical protein